MVRVRLASLRVRLGAALLMAVLIGCGSSNDRAAAPPPDPCPPTCPGSLAPLPSPTGSDPPEGSAAYDALVVAPEPGELARGGNDADASLTMRTFDVTVPAGSRLRTRTVCQGRTSVTVRIDPASQAESELPCTEDAPHELIVEEQEQRVTNTAYRVVVTAPSPARWYAVLSAVPGPPLPTGSPPQ